MASRRVRMPACRIHFATSALARRMAGEAKVRVIWRGSSEMAASASMRGMIFFAPLISSAAISRVSPGRTEEGDVVARGGVGDVEAHGHLVQKPDAGRGGGFGGEVIADEENDFVWTGRHFGGGEQRALGAAIGVGLGGGDELAFPAVEGPEFDFHSAGGAAVGGIEDGGALFVGPSQAGI